MTAINSQLTPSPDLVGLVIKDQLCDSSVFEGAFVYVDSGVAYNAIATGILTSRVIGVVESKSDSTTCDIRVAGLVEDILTGLDDNVNYFLSSTVAGTIGTTVVTGSGNVLLKIGRPITSTIFLLGIELRTIRI